MVDKGGDDDDVKGPVVIVVHVIEDSVRFTKQVLGTSLMLILVVLGAGLAMAGLRGLYFYMAPEIIKHSHSWVIIINAARLDFWYIIDELKILVYAVEKALHFISAGRFPHDVPRLRVLPFPKMVNASGLRQTLKVTTVACADLETGWDTLLAWVRSMTSDSVCPLLRAAWPLGSVNTTLQSSLSWLAYDANPQANNCAPDDYDPQLARSCVVVNFGFVLLEVILPVILVGLLLKHFFKSVVELLGFAWRLIRGVIRDVSVLGATIERKSVEWIELNQLGNNPSR